MVSGSAAGQMMRGLSDRGEASERGGELGCPGPAGVNLDPGLALAANDPAGGVQQLVAQLLDLNLGEHAVEEDGLGPGDQVGGGQPQLQPDGVDRELAGG